MKRPGYLPTGCHAPGLAKSTTESQQAGDAAPEIYRIVLGPSTETLWTDLAQLSESQTNAWELDTEQALEMEAKILNLTQPSLCLDPTFEVTRMANSVLRATTLACPESGTGDGVAGKRSKCPSNREEDDSSIKLEQYMRMMDETDGRAFAPTSVPR
jgi:hypothetical protein